MKRKSAAILASGALLLAMAVPASADPAFGPGHKGGGEGNSGPQVGKCHPPGQTNDRPECK